MKKCIGISFCFIFCFLPVWSGFANGTVREMKVERVRVVKKDVKGRGHEIQIRLAPQFGVLARENQNVLNQAFKKFILLLPEANVSFQITSKWFISSTFTYARIRDKQSVNALGVRQHGHADVYGITTGVRIVSSTEDPSEGDFFDDTRWWLNLEAGPYITHVRSPIIGNNDEMSFGLNAGAGFDYFFHRVFGTGLQIKLHYVTYSPDDYFLFSFGPHLTAKF